MVFAMWLWVTSSDFGASGCWYCHAGKEHPKLQLQNYSEEIKSTGNVKDRKRWNDQLYTDILGISELKWILELDTLKQKIILFTSHGHHPHKKRRNGTAFIIKKERKIQPELQDFVTITCLNDLCSQFLDLVYLISLATYQGDLTGCEAIMQCP